MHVRKVTVMVAALALALVVLPGCPSTKKFNDHVASTDARMNTLESGLEDAERRIDDLKKETDTKVGQAQGTANQAKQTADEALSSANNANAAAAAAANGKLLWTVKISDSRTKFALGKAELSAEAKGVLDDLVRKVKASNKGVYLEIEGHTDNTGSESLNMKLGEHRAMMVRDYLHQTGGMPLHAMTTISYGEGKPEADNSTREGRAQNRRVVVRVLE